MSGHELTDIQQRHTEQRILSDAEFIRGGAVINELGRLVITRAQHDELSGYEPDEQEIQSWLGTDIREIFESSNYMKVDYNRFLNKLIQNGLTDIRKVMVTGSYGIPGIGNRGRAMIEGLLQNGFGLEFKSLVSAEDAAVYCRDITEVPGRAIHKRILPGYTVQHIITSTPESLVISGVFDFYHDRGKYEADKQLEIAKNAHERCIKFAHDFEQAKQA